MYSIRKRTASWLTSSFALALAAVSFASGCASSATDSVGVDTQGLTASEQCSPGTAIFVDKVQYVGGDHGTARLHVWVKTLNDRLDGRITHVGFRARLSIVGVTPPVQSSSSCDNFGDCAKVGQWVDYPFQSFFGASDYFENDSTPFPQDFYIENDFIHARSYEGAFYVETDKGTRYWANAPASSGDNNFHFDANMVQNVERIQGSQHNYGVYSPDSTRAVATRESFPYLNPAGCR